VVKDDRLEPKASVAGATVLGYWCTEQNAADESAERLTKATDDLN
jgi:hypothetical protein